LATAIEDDGNQDAQKAYCHPTDADGY